MQAPAAINGSVIGDGVGGWYGVLCSAVFPGERAEAKIVVGIVNDNVRVGASVAEAIY